MINRRLVPIVLLAAALLLLTIGVVNADLKPTSVLRAWDYSKLGGGYNPMYGNGNMLMWLNDGKPESFYAQLEFDNDPHADACGTNTSSQWAGDAEINLAHVDDDPDGAPGFGNSSAWSIVKCSAFGTGKDEGTIRYPTAGDVLATCVAGQQQDGPCILISTNVEGACTIGNCKTQLNTTFHVNLDGGTTTPAGVACDNNIDPLFRDAGLDSNDNTADNLCLYWEAEKPSAPGWKGNLQARYGALGQAGAKTINFSDTFYGPNAVNVSALKATAEANRGSLGTWAGGLLLAAAALLVWRRKA